MALPAPISKNTGTYVSRGRPQCPFYGFNGMFGKLIESGGNECGLTTRSYSPCRMEIARETPNWRECPFNTEDMNDRIESGMMDMKVLPRELRGSGRRISLLDWARHVMDGEEL